MYCKAARSRASLNDKGEMTNDKEAQSALNISIFHSFHLSILLGVR
jgi:hypothetical protein